MIQSVSAVRFGAVVLALAVMAGAAACTSSSSGTPVSPSSVPGTTPSGTPSLPGSGGGATVTSGNGQLRVMMTDSPFSDAMAVLVTISGISVHRTAGGGWEQLLLEGGAITCDLKKLQGPADIIGEGGLPAGMYTQIRLMVASAGIYFENPSAGEDACAAEMEEPLGLKGTVVVPSGEIKINHPFTVLEGGGTMLLLDFDGDRSIKQTGSGGGACVGNGRGRGGACDPESAGTFIMTPVIGVKAVEESPAPPEAVE